MMSEDRQLLIKLSDKDKYIILFFIEYLNNIEFTQDDYLLFYKESTLFSHFNKRINLGELFNLKGGIYEREYHFDLHITKDFEFCYLWRGDSRDIDKFLNYIMNHVDYNNYELKKRLDRELENKQITKKVKI